jgi:hypothetical protein
VILWLTDLLQTLPPSSYGKRAHVLISPDPLFIGSPQLGLPTINDSNLEMSTSEGPSRDESNLELEAACEAEDTTRIRQLLTTTILGGSDTTRAFESPFSVPVLRCLLECGANASPVTRRHKIQCLDQLKLLAEFGFDVRSEGHLILQ